MRRRSILAVGLSFVVAPVVLVAIAAWYVSGLVLRPPFYEHRSPREGLRPLDDEPWAEARWQGIHHDPLVDLGLPFEDVAFPTEGGATLRGWLVAAGRSPSGIVIAVHGGVADRRALLRHTPIFRDAGYSMLLFDLREHGVSDGNRRGVSLGVREHRDVVAAVDFAQDVLQSSPIVVFGTSMGGSSAIAAAAVDHRIDAVIAENPGGEIVETVRDILAREYGLPRWFSTLCARAVVLRLGAERVPSAFELVAEIAPRPLLLIHGLRDERVPFEVSQRLFSAAGHPKDLWLVPDATHGTSFNVAPVEYRRRVSQFLGRHLAAPTDERG